MIGYYKNEAATHAAFTPDGWLRTGDLGLIDEEGNLFIKGRSKNMILGPSGQNIYPEEIEDHLNNLPYVCESIVVEKEGKLTALIYPDFEAINAELDSINAQISYYDGEIARKEAERREAEAKEQAQYERFCERVRAMEEEGTVSYWSILFNAENFSDMLDRLADIDAVMDYDNQVMEELTAARQELERLQAELESARAEEQAAKDQQEAKKAEQQAKVAEAQKLLDQINADAAELNRQLDDEMEGAAEIQAEIARKQKQLEEERRQNNVTIDSETNYLWPLPGYYRLTSLFGYRIHPITGKAHSHTGIDIPAPEGTPVLAAASGTVEAEGWDGEGGLGDRVILAHGGGWTTTYGQLSQITAVTGETVEQGEVIGYVGATGRATGPHLHLELAENGVPTDPAAAYPGLELSVTGR